MDHTEAFGLSQLVTSATHEGGSILDLVFTMSSDDLVRGTSVLGYFSDHRRIDQFLSHCPVEHHAFHLCRSLFGGSATLTRKLSSTTLNVEPHHLSIWRPRLPRRSIQRWPSFSHRQTCINRLEKSHSPPIHTMDH